MFFHALFILQLDEELKELSTSHDVVVNQAKNAEATAKNVMKNLRALQRKDWDEQRVTPGASLEALKSKVHVFCGSVTRNAKARRCAGANCCALHRGLILANTNAKI